MRGLSKFLIISIPVALFITTGANASSCGWSIIQSGYENCEIIPVGLVQGCSANPMNLKKALNLTGNGLPPLTIVLKNGTSENEAILRLNQCRSALIEAKVLKSPYLFFYSKSAEVTNIDRRNECITNKNDSLL